MTSFVTSFCYISLILQLRHLLEHLSLIFRKCLSWFKLSGMIRGTFWQNICWYHDLFLHHWSRCLAIFPSFCNFIAFWSIFTWILQNVCRGWSCLTWLEEHSSNIIFLMLSLFFYLWHHLWRQFAIFPSFYNYIAFWPLELDF